MTELPVFVDPTKPLELAKTKALPLLLTNSDSMFNDDLLFGSIANLNLTNSKEIAAQEQNSFTAQLEKLKKKT